MYKIIKIKWQAGVLLSGLVAIIYLALPATVSAACTTSIQLLKGSSVVKGTTLTAPTADYAKYKLQVKASGCTGTLSIYTNRAGDITSIDMQPDQPIKGSFSKTFTFGVPAEDTYKYGVAVTDDSHLVLSRSDLAVTWGNGTSTNPSSTNPGAGGTATPGATGVAGKSNAQINSGVSVTPGQSYDTIVGYFQPLTDFKTVPELIIRLINIGLLLAGMVAMIVIIVGGFNLVTAMGNETKITKGKRSIMWAIAGLVVCLLSYSIVAIIQGVISR